MAAIARAAPDLLIVTRWILGQASVEPRFVRPGLSTPNPNADVADDKVEFVARPGINRLSMPFAVIIGVAREQCNTAVSRTVEFAMED